MSSAARAPDAGSKGTYLLLLAVDKSQPAVAIGRLGCFDLAAGYYLYVGSAFGTGGLPARLARHREQHKARPHWHIDHLRAHTRLCAIWAVACPLRLEHAWCTALATIPGLTMPIRGFGAGDSHLPSHLFYAPAYPAPRLLSRALLRNAALSQPELPAVQISIDHIDHDADAPTSASTAPASADQPAHR